MGSDVDAMEKLIKMSDYVTEYHACLTFLIEMRLVKDRHAVQSAEKMVELDRLIDKEMQKICQREK